MEFPFAHVDVFLPLSLGFVATGEEWEDSEFYPETRESFTGRLWAYDTYVYSGPETPYTPPTFVLEREAALFPKTLNISRSLTTKQLLFQLSTTPDWKMAIGLDEPLKAWSHRGDRSFGRFRFAMGAHFAFDTLSFGPNSERSFNFTSSSTPITSELHIEYLQPGQTNTEHIPTPTSGFMTSHSNHRFVNGPRRFLNLAVPEDDGDAESQDQFATWLGGERRFYACQVIGSAGLNLSQSFYAIPRAEWGTETDWWLANAANWLSGGLGTRLGPPRDIPPAANPQLVTASAGVTILPPADDGAMMWFYDAFALTVQLP
jgi:hypothetical protein